MIEEKKFYTCKYDRPFKEIFLNEKNKHLLKGLLETILKVKINKIEIKPNERNSKNLEIKRKHLDALIYTEDKKIGIELNSNAKETYVRPRNASYIFDVYSSHTLIGEIYNEEIKIIQINLSYNLKDKEKVRVYKLRDKEGKEYIENLYIYEINMDYYKEIWYTKNEKEKQANKYLVMLDLGLKELKEFAKKEKVVYEYMEKLESLNESPEFHQYMSHEEDERKIYNTRMYEATKKGLESGLKQGLEKGLKQGLEQGLEQGIEKTAKRMLEMNMVVEDIMKVTDLTKEQIKNLK